MIDTRALVVTDGAALEALGPEWRALQADADHTLFLTWQWVAAWWKHFGDGRQLFVTTVRDAEGALIGVAPLCRRLRPVVGGYGLRALEFTGAGSPAWADDLGVLARPGLEPAVLAAVAGALRSRRGAWDVAELTDLRGGAPVAEGLSAALERAGFTVAAEPGGVCPYLPLGEPWAVYEERAHRKFRDLKKYLQRLDKAGVRFGVVEDEASLERALDALVRLNRERMASKSDVASLTNDAFVAFVRDFARAALAAGWLRFHVAEQEGTILGVNLNFGYRGRVYGYMSGFDPDWQRHGLGTCLLYHAIRAAWEARFEVYDFLRGDEAYKYRWTTEERKTQALRVVSNARRWAVVRATTRARRVAGGVWRRARRLLERG